MCDNFLLSTYAWDDVPCCILLPILESRRVADFCFINLQVAIQQHSCREKNTLADPLSCQQGDPDTCRRMPITAELFEPKYSKARITNPNTTKLVVE